MLTFYGGFVCGIKAVLTLNRETRLIVSDDTHSHFEVMNKEHGIDYSVDVVSRRIHERQYHS